MRTREEGRREREGKNEREREKLGQTPLKSLGRVSFLLEIGTHELDLTNSQIIPIEFKNCKYFFSLLKVV